MAFLETHVFSQALEVAVTVNVLLPEPSQGIGLEGAKAGTHFAWHLNCGTYRNKVFLPQWFLAITPGINRRHGAGGGISCARPRFRQRRIRGSRSDLAFTK